MKVLMTTDTIGGVWTYALELAEALAERGVEVVLATMGGGMSAEQRRSAARLDLEVHESDFKLEWMDDPWEDVRRAGPWLLDLEARTGCDVVHLNGYAHGGLRWRSPVLMVAHSCVLSWWWAVKNEPAPAEWNKYRAAVREGIREADLVLAPTHAMLREAERHYGPLPDRGVVLNGRIAAGFPPGEKEPLILSAGRLWDEAKNIQALHAVASRLDWPVYVAGAAHAPRADSERGPRAAIVRERTPASRERSENRSLTVAARSEIGSSAGLVRLGQLSPPTLARWLGRASIYALPARYEPFGLSALEAALAGCALVLNDIPTLREVWGDAAMFVNAEDTDELQAALTGLIRDGRRRDQFARLASQRAHQLTPHRMADGYLDTYRRLIRNATQPPSAVPVTGEK